MNPAVINIRTDSKLKAAAAKLARDLGLDLSGVMNGFLREFVRSKSVSFSLASEEPSEYLKKAIANAERERREGWVSPAFSDAKAAIAWLNNPKRQYVRDLQPEVYKTKRKSAGEGSRGIRKQIRAIY
jgi:addiction module RelB/DinJ family antitoxin